MRIEKDGFVLHLEGTWLEIANKYGVQEKGDVAMNEEDIPEEFAERKLNKFIEEHSVRDMEMFGECIKRVAFSPAIKDFVQLQAVYIEKDNVWVVQMYDNEMIFMGEEWSGCQYQDEVLDWMRTNYEIEKCLTAEVYRNGLGDCTNGGYFIKSERVVYTGRAERPI